MASRSIGRIVGVTLALSGIGLVVGAILGALLYLMLSLVDHGSADTTAWIGGVVGGAMGLVLAPVAAWTLMRHVPIWRAITETAVATVVGVASSWLLAALFHPRFESWTLSPLGLGAIGFILAAVRLRFSVVSSNPAGIVNDPNEA